MLSCPPEHRAEAEEAKGKTKRKARSKKVGGSALLPANRCKGNCVVRFVEYATRMQTVRVTCIFSQPRCLDVVCFRGQARNTIFTLSFYFHFTTVVRKMSTRLAQKNFHVPILETIFTLIYCCLVIVV